MCVGDDMGGELVCFLSGVSVDVGCPVFISVSVVVRPAG